MNLLSLILFYLEYPDEKNKKQLVVDIFFDFLALNHQLVNTNFACGRFLAAIAFQLSYQ